METPSKRVLIVAGEPSGDMHAARLIEELRTLEPGLRVEAMGGEALAGAGAEIIVDNRELAVVGLVEVLRHYPEIRRALNRLRQRLKQAPPDLLILVDYVEFNLKLAAAAKALGIPVLFYISPQVWAWRQGRVKKIGERIDMMAVIFPFEVEFYQRHGIPVRYVGNPLAGKVRATRSIEENRARFGVSGGRPVIGLQPGSRQSEISRLAPVFAETAETLRARRPDAQFLLPVAPGIDAEWLRSLLPEASPIIVVDNDSAYNVMQVCDAILTACGTATLETALMGVPMVAAYQVSPLTYPLLRRLIKIPHVALANIVAGREVVREFIQDAATPEAMARELARLIEDQGYRDEVREGLDEIRKRIGDQNGSRNVALLAREMLL